MMEKTITYKWCFRQIGNGINGLGECMCQTVKMHPVVTILSTLLLISVAVNIWQAAVITEQRLERDQASVRMYRLEQRYDSLRGADVRYISYTQTDIADSAVAPHK